MLCAPPGALDFAVFLAELKRIPFRLCGAGPPHLGPWRNLGFQDEGFGQGHHGHGFLAAFKGDGHRRVASRRFLGHGPWRLLYFPEDDLSVVLFHDFAATPEEALAQAQPGVLLLGNVPQSGYIFEKEHYYQEKVGGLYVAQDRTFRIVVHGRDVGMHEMHDAFAMKYWQGADENKPVEDVAFVFIEEDRARRHLHDLWLRGLQCRTIVKGREVRLDTDYVPPDTKPQWVRDWEAREPTVDAMCAVWKP